MKQADLEDMLRAAFMLRLALVGFTIVLGWEWLMPVAWPQPRAVRVGGVAASAQHASKQLEHATRFADTVLARPLFSQSRRPPPREGGPGTASDKLPRLSGIMIAGFERAAIFEGEGKPVVTSVGDHVGDYKIIAIVPTAVTVSGPHGEELVSLAFDANRKPVTPPAFIGGNLLERFRSHRPPRLPVPPPPSMEQMLSHLRRPS